MEVILVILAAVGGFTAIGVIHNVGTAWAARIRAAPRDGKNLGRRLQDIEQRLAETEAQLAELAGTHEGLIEIDERLEFAERLIQQQRERVRLPPREE